MAAASFSASSSHDCGAIIKKTPFGAQFIGVTGSFCGVSGEPYPKLLLRIPLVSAKQSTGN
jgi:hypothetical protein